MKNNKFTLSLILASLALSGCGSDSNNSDSNNGGATNNAPEITSTAQLISVQDLAYSYTLTASDSDNNDITLSATELPAWLTFDSNSGVLSGTPAEGDIGEYSITLMASDDTDETAQTFTLVVSAAASDSVWAIVWRDEFNGDAIDTDKWNHEIDCNGGGNNEKQCYTDEAKNSYIEDGILKIAALPETNLWKPYSSARINTKNKGDWKYGRFEIRAKSVLGQGSFPAIWMLPTDGVYGGWPHSGEIDIFESVNLGVPLEGGGVQSEVHGTLHYGEAWPNNSHSGREYLLPNDLNPAHEFHIYAVEWEEGEIRWYVDDVLFQTQTKSETILNDGGDVIGLAHQGWYTDNTAAQEGLVWNNAPYDQNFHLIINFAVGGSWSENVDQGGVDSTAFNADNTLEIDYVRVYECSVNPATGQGCATVTPGYNDLVADGGTLVNGKSHFNF